MVFHPKWRMMNKEPENELFYWFDIENDTVEELIEEEFRARIEEIRQAQLNWENIVA